MKKPRLKKIAELDNNTIIEIEEMIKETLENNYIQSWPIENVSHLLDPLTEYAKENDIIVTLKAEHSNLHQGVIVNLLQKQFLDGFTKHI